MDRTFDGLPYRIPGPAGGSGWDTPSHTSHRSSGLPKPDAERRFNQRPWHAMLQHARVTPRGTQHFDASLALLRSYALGARFEKVSLLPVFVDSISWVGKDASVLLRDPTGNLRATIHAAVFEERKDQIEVGAVMLLRGVTALSYQERRATGFRLDHDSSLHMSIQPSNVQNVFPVSVKLDTEHKIEMISATSSYTSRAINPPQLPSRPPVRKSPPPHLRREPLRPRSEAQNRQPFRRPHTANAQPNLHGTLNGRAHPNQYQQQGYRQQPPSNQFSGKRPGPQIQPPTHLQHAQRRKGMPPMPKRHAPNPTPTSTDRPAPAPLNSLTDDQLDSLLGDVDIDAIVAARSHSSAPTGNIPPISSSTPVGSTPAAPSMKKTAATPLELLPNVQDNPALQPVKHAAEQPGNNAPPNKQQLTPVETLPSGVGKSSEKPAATVDEAMIDSLLEGLDGSDFG